MHITFTSLITYVCRKLHFNAEWVLRHVITGIRKTLLLSSVYICGWLYQLKCTPEGWIIKVEMEYCSIKQHYKWFRTWKRKSIFRCHSAFQVTICAGEASGICSANGRAKGLTISLFGRDPIFKHGHFLPSWVGREFKAVDAHTWRMWVPFCVDPSIHTLSFACVLSMFCLEGPFFLQDKKVKWLVCSSSACQQY